MDVVILQLATISINGSRPNEGESQTLGIRYDNTRLFQKEYIPF
jgi:hypothetical protein